MAAELKKEPGVQVVLLKGGLGEISVSISGQKAFDSSRFWYPRPSRVLDEIRILLAK